MVEIILYKRDGINVGYKVNGHAMYGEHGNDVVCAALSVLAINTENAIDILTDDQFKTEMNEDGFVQVMMTDKVSHDAAVLLSAFEIGVTTISEEYGKKYIKIQTEEV